MNKFEFDTQKERCWYWNKDGEKKEVDKDCKIQGNFGGQIAFVLDREHPSHWVNYRITYFKSLDKVFLKTWYKKRVEDNSLPEKARFVHYEKRVEKLTDIIAIEFTEDDEMVKVFSEKKEKDIYVNKLEREKQLSS